MKKLLYVILLCVMVSCTQTRYIEVPVEKVRTEYVKEYQKDTLIVRDSVDRWLKNDTVFLYKYKYIYKTMYQTDTVRLVDTITNTIYIDKIITVNELKDYQKFLIYMGLFALGFIIFVLYKKFKL